MKKRDQAWIDQQIAVIQEWVPRMGLMTESQLRLHIAECYPNEKVTENATPQMLMGLLTGWYVRKVFGDAKERSNRWNEEKCVKV